MLSDHHGDVCPLAVTNIEQGSLLSVSGLLHFPATWGLWSRQQTKMDIQHSTAFSKGDRTSLPSSLIFSNLSHMNQHSKYFPSEVFFIFPFHISSHCYPSGMHLALTRCSRGSFFLSYSCSTATTCITKWAPHTQVQRLRLHVPSSAALRHWRNSVGTFRAERSLIFWNSSFGLFSSYLRSASPFIHSQFKRFRNAQSLAPH